MPTEHFSEPKEASELCTTSVTRQDCQKPVKRDRRTVLTRRKILETTEALIARHGIQAVSYRMIARACSMRNNVVVQYHFGTMEELYDEIMRTRMQQLDVIRQNRMIDIVWPEERYDRVARAVELLCLPHLELGNDEQGYNYASFLSQYIPLCRAEGVDLMRRQNYENLPAMESITQVIKNSLQLPDELINRRISNCTLLFFNVLQNLHAHKAGEMRNAVIEDSLKQSIAILLA